MTTTSDNSMDKTKCGFVAIIGRANVGKSTLFNSLIGTQLSLINRKSQTTRHLIKGVVTDGLDQVVFVDTPGLDTRNSKHRFNKSLNNAFMQTIKEVDLVIWVLDRNLYTNADVMMEKHLRDNKTKILIIINKMDLVRDAGKMLPVIQKISDRINFKTAGIIPISASKKYQTGYLLEQIKQYMPPSPWLYDQDQITDAPKQFFASETIRGEILKQLNQELPYASAVVIEKYEQQKNQILIMAIIYVETAQHKQIIIGKAGSKLTTIGTQARLKLEQQLNQKVNLRLWIKVKPKWRDTGNFLHDLHPS